MRRLVFLVLVIAMLATVTETTYAGVSWCPSFSIEGTELDVLLDTEEEIDPSATWVVVRVPRGVEANIVDSGGFRCKIVHRGRAEDDEIPVTVTVLVPRGAGRFDVRVTVEVPEYGILKSRDGTTGRPIKVKVKIPING
ncbi:MAG: hypothetical protein U9R11_00580 [Chloroflexota bacterium]|nr:hypothetical protein [Chloroflexota bacterium]